MLLPMPECAAREISLVNHLSFAACRSGAGSAYLFNELIRLVYLSFYVQDAGFGGTDLMIYARVEAAIERSLERAESGRAWMLDADDLPLSRRCCVSLIVNSPTRRGMSISARTNDSNASRPVGECRRCAPTTPGSRP